MALDPSAPPLPHLAAAEGERRPLTPGILLLMLLLGYFLFRIRLVVELTVLAILYGTAIERPVRALEGRISRRAAILVVDGLILAALVLPALAFAPSASREISNLRANEPAELRKLEAHWRTSSNSLLRGPGAKLIDRAVTALEAPPKAPSKTTLTVAFRAFKILIAILACISMAFSYLMEKDRLRRRLLDQIGPNNRVRASRLWDACEGAVGGWLRSRIILGIVVGVFTTIVFGALRVPYWPLLGILAGVTEPVPIIGPWAGGIPAALLALTRSPLLGIGVVLIIFGRQLLVDTVLVPRITKEAVGLSPLTVFVAVLAGTELLGPPGALLAIPVAAVIQIAVVDYLTARRGVGVPPDYGWRWLLARRSGQIG